MSRDGYVHQVSQTRPVHIGLFNKICWVAGFVFSVFFLGVTSNLWYLIIFPIALIIGIPVKDAGSPHAWILRKLRQRRSVNRKGGVMVAPPLSRHGKIFSSAWDDFEIVTHGMRVGEDVVLLPLVALKKKTHLIAYLKINSGAAGRWAAEDGEGKYEWDASFFKAISNAVSVTDEPDVCIAPIFMSRPNDQTVGFEYNRGRLHDKMLAGAESDQSHTEYFDEVDKDLGLNAMDHHDTGYAEGGDTFNYIAVRMPWPKRHFRHINIEDPDVFAKTKLSRTIKKLLIELGHCDLDIERTNRSEVAQLLNNSYNLKQLATRHTYGQRDREMLEDGKIKYLDDGPSSRPEAYKPLSVTFDKKKPNYIVCDGTFIAAGYIDTVTQPYLAPGFLELALAFAENIYFSAATICQMKLIGPEKRKAKNAERINVMSGDIASMDSRLSDPDGAIRKNQQIIRREELSVAGARSSDDIKTFVVLANSHEELEAHWDSAITTTSRTYEIKRVEVPDEIVDIVLGTLLIVDNN